MSLPPVPITQLQFIIMASLNFVCIHFYFHSFLVKLFSNRLHTSCQKVSLESLEDKMILFLNITNIPYHTLKN